MQNFKNWPWSSIRMGAGIVMVLSFFLPIFNLSGFGGISGLDMVTSVAGIKGEPSNILFIVPGVLVLLFHFLFKRKGGSIGCIIVAVCSLLLMLFAAQYISSKGGGLASLGFGAILNILASIVVIVASVFLIKALKI